MASFSDELEARLRVLADMDSRLHDRFMLLEEGNQTLKAELQELRLLGEGQRAELQREVQRVAEMQQMVLPMKEQLGRMTGQLEGKRETTTLLVSAFLSGLGLVISVLLGLLNLQGRSASPL